MRKHTLKVGVLLTLSLMLLVVVTVVAQTDTVAYEAVLISNDDLHLTVYPNNGMLVRDTRTFQLQAGLNRLSFASVSTQIRRDSIAISTDDDNQIYTVEQRFATAESPPSIDVLLFQNVGQNISVTILNPSEGENNIVYEGLLVSYISNMLTIQLEDNTLVTVNRVEIREFRLPELNTERIEVPTLQITVNSVEGGEFPVTITYLAEGLNWQNTNYNLTLSADGESLDVTGWITVNNNSGVSFDNASVTLSGGNLNLLQFVSRDTQFASPTASPSATQTAPAGGMGGGGIIQQQFQQLQQPPELLLDLPNALTIPTNETVLIEFLEGAVSEAGNVYVYDASPRVFGYSSFITNPDYGQTQVTTVQNFLAFSTGAEAGLGLALPAGNMRIYQENEDNATLLIGQTQLAYTPEGETIRLFLNNPEDLHGERTQTEFIELSSNAIQETYEIRLMNDGEDDINIIVPERMTRWSNWEMLGASTAYEQTDAFGVEFMVTVPAGGETTISYTVLYTNTN